MNALRVTTPVDDGYRGAHYDLITAVTDPASGGISYTVNTQHARMGVRAHTMQKPLLRDLVAKASNPSRRDELIGRTLFRLLVPVELEAFFASTTDTVLELDAGTTGIPWEMLDTAAEPGVPARPWALNTRLLRKLRTRIRRPQVVDSIRSHRVLVIGEPACDPRRYPRLPGAREEAAAVAKCLEEGGLGPAGVMGLFSRERSNPGASARTIINTLLSDDWRIVHISGHGEPPAKGADGSEWEPRGVVLSDGLYLGAREILSMRAAPELVFVNCDHLAARNLGALLQEDDYDQPEFASTVAEALIRVGVRCVIAPGGAISDKAAQAFATAFYEELVKGSRFIEAVAAAREAAYALGGNTWAAYQCYGDPDWTFVARAPSPVPPHDGSTKVVLPKSLPGTFLSTPPAEVEPKSADTPDVASSSDTQPARPPSQVLEALAVKLDQLMELNPTNRGLGFERFLGELFEYFQLAPRSAFSLVGEQIDGSFDLGGATYLVEAKWHKSKIGQAELLVFSGKIASKAQWARGVFISISGFTDKGLKAFATGRRTNLICIDRSDLDLVLSAKINLREMIMAKARRAAKDNRAFVPAAELFLPTGRAQ